MPDMFDDESIECDSAAVKEMWPRSDSIEVDDSESMENFCPLFRERFSVSEVDSPLERDVCVAELAGVRMTNEDSPLESSADVKSFPLLAAPFFSATFSFACIFVVEAGCLDFGYDVEERCRCFGEGDKRQYGERGSEPGVGCGDTSVAGKSDVDNVD